MYNSLKTQLAELLGISKDALHIHVGLAIFVLAWLVLQRFRWAPWGALVVIALFEIGNEFMDLFHWHAGTMSMEVGDMWTDLLNTLIWPLVATLVIVARRSRPTSPLSSPSRRTDGICSEHPSRPLDKQRRARGFTVWRVIMRGLSN